MKLPSLRAPEIRLGDGGDASKSAPRGRWTIVISGTVVGALATVAVAWIQATPKSEDPEHAPMLEEIEALQARVDTVQTEQTQLKRCVRLLGEAVCALNEGPMGSGWDECPPHVYRDNRNPPPLHRTDRVYADCMDLLR